MKIYRSILSLGFALITIFLVSCSSPVAVAPPVYSPTQISQVARYQGVLQGFRDQFPRLGEMIAIKQWVDVGTFIHGPLGELRQKTSYVIRNIVPEAGVKKANTIADQMFASLEAIDKDAAANDFAGTNKNYKKALGAFDEFLQLLGNLS